MRTHPQETLRRKFMETSSSTQIQEFYYRAPEATSVQLVGDFTHWRQNPVQMHKQAGGTWKAEVSLAPGTYHYRFLVDGEWRDDPDCTVRVPNIFGGHNMVREVVAVKAKAPAAKPVAKAESAPVKVKPAAKAPAKPRARKPKKASA